MRFGDMSNESGASIVLSQQVLSMYRAGSSAEQQFWMYDNTNGGFYFSKSTAGKFVLCEGSTAAAYTRTLMEQTSRGASGMTFAGDVTLNGDIYSVDWTSWASSNVEGIDDWTGGWCNMAYKKIGDMCYMNLDLQGHMNAGSGILHITLPYTLASTTISLPAVICNNSAWSTGAIFFHTGVSTAQAICAATEDGNYDNFNTGAGAAKGVRWSGFYRTA